LNNEGQTNNLIAVITHTLLEELPPDSRDESLKRKTRWNDDPCIATCTPWIADRYGFHYSPPRKELIKQGLS
jgi:hypothetical protein